MEGWKGGEVEGWKNGRMEGWKGGRMEGWKGGRVEGWKDGRVGRLKAAYAALRGRLSQRQNERSEGEGGGFVRLRRWWGR